MQKIDLLDNEQIHFVGRHTIDDNGLYICNSYSGFEFCCGIASFLTIHLDINAAYYDDRFDHQYISVYIDDKYYKKIKLISNITSYDIDIKVDVVGLHKVAIYRANEASFASLLIKSICIDGGDVVAFKNDKRIKIEVVGDSISTGFGVSSDSKEEMFSLTTQDASLSYGAILSRAINADSSIIAHSGIGLYRSPWISDIHILDIVDTIDEKIKCNKEDMIADIYINNLCTNDDYLFAPLKGKEKEIFKSGLINNYLKLINFQLSLNKNATIYLLASFMNKASDNLIEALMDVVNHFKDLHPNKVKLIELTPRGGGAENHPDKFQHETVASLLEKIIIKDLSL